MSTRSPKKEKLEPVAIDIMDYDNLKAVLSKIVMHFSEIIDDSSVPDVYAGYERIPFEKRDQLYKTIMKQEFADAMRALKTDT
ncbi:MAG: hypothetical protein ACTSSC_06700 [Promethearchaeota archaeon]